MTHLLLLSFLWFATPSYADPVFPAPLCVVQKGITDTGKYILFYNNGTRRIVSKQEFDSTNVGDCTWS